MIQINHLATPNLTMTRDMKRCLEPFCTSSEPAGTHTWPEGSCASYSSHCFTHATLPEEGREAYFLQELSSALVAPCPHTLCCPPRKSSVFLPSGFSSKHELLLLLSCMLFCPWKEAALPFEGRVECAGQQQLQQHLFS